VRASTLHPSEHVPAPSLGASVSQPPRPTQGLAPSRPAGRLEGDASHRVAGVVVATDVDVVIPVYNEERGLDSSVRRLHRFLSTEFPFSWRIVIADNASTDATAVIAQALAEELPGVKLVRLEAKGRGRALRAAWSASDARVVCYMDVDLSTDLKALLPLGGCRLGVAERRLTRARHRRRAGNGDRWV
jgi:hypothetical protein